MSNVVVINRLPQFGTAAEAAMDKALSNAGAEILRLSKNQAPHLTGLLWSSGKLRRLGKCNFEVSYDRPYAAYQEWGSYPDGSHVIRRHTEPGTKTFYLRDPGDLVTEKSHFEGILKVAGGSVR